MTPGTRNLEKIGCFNAIQIIVENFLRLSNESALRFFDLALFHGFFQVLSPRVHETLQQSDASIFSNFHHLEKGHGRTFNKK